IIINEMKRLKITFQFWYETNSNNLSYTLLMRPDKLNIFQNFNLRAIFQSTSRAIQIQNLWNQFFEFYSLMQNNETTSKVFGEKAQNWLISFLALSQGQPNKS